MVLFDGRAPAGRRDGSTRVMKIRALDGYHLTVEMYFGGAIRG
jgi:hypothetical protein